MLKKFLLSLVVLFGVGTLFANKTYAAVDIELADDPENKTLSVIINSNESYVDGLDLNILFSEDVTISEVSMTENFCTMGGNSSFEETTLSIECLNDSETEMNGVLATVIYATEASDYFFYLDEDSADLGSLTLGEIINVNKPENVVSEEVEEEVTEEEKELTDTVIDFLSDNSLYVLAGVITLIAVVVAIVGFTNKEEKVQ